MKNIKPTHRKFAKNIAKSIAKNSGEVIISEEYKKVYPSASDATSRANASELMARQDVQLTVKEYIDKFVTDESIAKKISAMCNATKEHELSSGEVVNWRDNPTRLTAILSILKIKGALNDKASTFVDARSVTYNISDATVQRFIEVVDEFKRLRQAPLIESKSGCGDGG